MADIVLINPRFQVSYWGLEHALPLLGKKCNLPTACLPLLAALTPAGHSVTIVDENVEPIDYDRLARGRHRRAHRHDRPARSNARDSARTENPRCLHDRRGSVGECAGRLFRWPGRCDLHRRGGNDLAAVSRRMGRGPASAPLPAGRGDRHDSGAGAALRPAEGQGLFVRQCPIQPRLSVPMRVLRHHRHVRS